MFKKSLFATLLLSAFTVVAAPAQIAAPAQSTVESATVSLGVSNQNAAPASACGYWDYRAVTVCDTVIETIEKPVTHCEYTWYNSSIGEPMDFVIVKDGHVQCAQRSGRGRLSSSWHTTQTVTETRQVNCRTEYRDVWIPITCGNPIP
jgi:hypothetical protein